jgi:inosose dehydratase
VRTTATFARTATERERSNFCQRDKRRARPACYPYGVARIACSPAAWGPDLRFEEYLDHAADLGYVGVEATPAAVATFVREKERARLRGLLEERHLTLIAAPVVGHFFDRDQRSAELDALRRTADFVAEINGGAMIVFRTAAHPGRRDMVVGQPPILPLTRDRLARLADTLNELADRCRDYGLSVAVQNRVGTYLETPGEYREVVERTEPDLVGLAPDLGHWAYAGGDVDDLVREWRDRLVYPRLKDFQREVFDKQAEERHGFRAFVEAGGFTALGAGSLPLEAALLRLERVEYAGWLCVELEPLSPAAVENPRAAMQAGREFLRERLHW